VTDEPEGNFATGDCPTVIKDSLAVALSMDVQYLGWTGVA
jgi:hypothetical protein